jgi:hypothetical protein
MHAPRPAIRARAKRRGGAALAALAAFAVLSLAVAAGGAGAQPTASPTPRPPVTADTTSPLLLRPARVWDGDGAPHEGWVVLVRGGRIAAAGPATSVATGGAREVALPGMTLVPGLIDAHSHVLLHPYDETPWNDQVLREPLALRVARAVNHLRLTLDAGFTTLRDLGSEGAADADVGLRTAVERGIVPGPRLLVAERAIVATGSYAPKGFDTRWQVPQGPPRGRRRRRARARGAHADRPRRRRREALRRLRLGAATARPAHLLRGRAPPGGRDCGERRAPGGGAREHGRGDASRDARRRARPSSTATTARPEVFRLMAQRGVALCPTLAAGDAIARYRGWRRGVDPSQRVSPRSARRSAPRSPPG